MDGTGKLLLVGVLSVLMTPLGFLSVAGAGVSDEQHYDYDGHNYDSYQVDFLDGDYIDIKYTMDSNNAIDVYLMNRSNFQAYRTNHGVGGWPGVAYIYNLSDLETNHTKISGSLTVRDSYFFVFEYGYMETHIDFGINYEIKSVEPRVISIPPAETAANNTTTNQINTTPLPHSLKPTKSGTISQRDMIYIAIIGGVIGVALIGSYTIALKGREIYETVKRSVKFGKHAENNPHTNYQAQEIITVDPLSNEGPSVMNSVHEKVNISNSTTTIVMNDCVINRSFTDMGAPKFGDNDDEKMKEG